MFLQYYLLMNRISKVIAVTTLNQQFFIANSHFRQVINWRNVIKFAGFMFYNFANSINQQEQVIDIIIFSCFSGGSLVFHALYCVSKFCVFLVFMLLRCRILNNKVKLFIMYIINSVYNQSH